MGMNLSSDITELKGLTKPPQTVIETIAVGTMLIYDEFEQPVAWDNCRKKMASTDFCYRLKNIDKKSITAAKIKHAKNFLQRPPDDQVSQCSAAAGGLYKFIVEMTS